ncbi:uncharacterized protein LOC125204596 isoform X2 [Salvia hispanica]|nr:uncharacterized protein LOC125204596 isoform X2 [Salvia hispanica]XP_047959248.1 uncharacterized protein LOC125204596 isoform X2 [Salvia hispanica]XP_047959249.1 uncharacterized protein LOC125204596 isoform X2 [Salvia hispanica]
MQIEEQSHLFTLEHPVRFCSGVQYELRKDSFYSSFMVAITDMSSNDPNSNNPSDSEVWTCFRNTRAWYDTQKSFGKYENTLKISHFDGQNSVILTEKVDMSLHEWLAKELSDGFESKPAAVNGSSIWWKKIKPNFVSIFGSILRGLRALHKDGKYHGNLLNGVAIKQIDKPKGILFNMVQDPRQITLTRQTQDPRQILTRQTQDIISLDTLLRWVLMYPFLQDPARALPKLVDEYERLCFLQLRHRIDNELPSGTWLAKWDLNLAIFWDELETIRFMKSVCRMVQDLRDFETVFSRLFTSNWKKRVKNEDMQRILNNSTYTDVGIQKLRFWRNCIEHIRVTAGDKSVEVRIHRLVTKDLPELLPEVVAAYHDYLRLADLKQCAESYSVFKDMRWT